jgi:hypothetical protein
MMSWNPLLNVLPESLHAALELLAKRLGGPYQLVSAPGPRNKRWPFFHTGDKLVHALLGLHRTYHWQVGPGVYVPVEAITECGVLALLSADQQTKVSRYDSGSIAPGGHVTCLRCASGVDGEGQRFRDVQKESAFGRLYGKKDGFNMSAAPLNSSRPNMQQVPRKRSP